MTASATAPLRSVAVSAADVSVLGGYRYGLAEAFRITQTETGAQVVA